jgi:hypothetical protein
VTTRINIVTARDFIEITTGGIIDIATSRQLLADIAKTGHLHSDYELLVDFRGTQSQLSTTDVYRLAEELCRHGDTFHRKVALVVTPGVNFVHASFFETCSHNRGFSVNAYTDYEKAIRWILNKEI